MADQIDYEGLARRAIACKRWRWIAGMRYAGTSWRDSLDYVRVRDDPDHAAALNGPREPGEDELLPDLSDFATRGCLLELVRTACGDPGISVSFDGKWWVHESGGGFLLGGGEDADGRWGPYFASEAEALVAALEAAPG